MSSDETLNCVLCKEAFTDKETLQEHFRKHGDRNFDQSTKLQKHKNEGEYSDKKNVIIEVVQCDVCEEVFSTISKAITHKHKAHPDHNTKYFCSWCGKLFTMKHLYNKHYSNHENMERGEDVFHCDHCDVDFYKVSAMAYHNNSVHRDFELPDIGHSRKQKLMNQDLVIVYYCPFCGEENVNKVNVNKHINDDHSGEDQSPNEVLRCPLCDAIFYHLDAYEAHLTYHTPDDIYNGIENAEDAVMSEYSLDTCPPVVEKVEDIDESTAALENLLGMVDEDTSERRKHKKKHKKHKKSKKETITLDEFLSMSDVLGGEGLDVHGIELVPTQSLTKNFKTKPRPQLPKLNKRPMSQIDKLKQQGIIVKKSNTKGILPKPVSRIALHPKVTAKNSSTEVISKLLNQSGSQLVISKKPAIVAKTIQDAHKDLSSPDLINKSHESLEVECDLPPCSSSDIDNHDDICNTCNKVKCDENKLDAKASNSDSVESSTTENKKPEDKESVQEETTKNSMDILKGLSHLITVKSVAKPDKTLDDVRKQNRTQDNKLGDSENSASTKVDEDQSEPESVKQNNEKSPHINSPIDETDSKTLNNIDGRGFLEKVLEQITVKTISKPNSNQERAGKEDTIEKNAINRPPNSKPENNSAIVNKPPKQIIQNELQSPPNIESSTENKKPSNLDILKGLGQNIVIKSSPKQSYSATNTSNDVLMSNCDDLENNIPESVIAKPSAPIENKTISEQNSRVQQPSNSNSTIPDVFKNLCRSITIKSNNSQNPTVQQSTHDDIENSDGDEDGENDTNFENAIIPKANSGINISKQTSIQPAGSVNNDQKVFNTFKSNGQNATVKPPSLQSQNTKIGSIQPSSAVVRKSVAPKPEVVPSNNLAVFKNLSKHITVKSSKPLATSSENEYDNQTDDEENHLATDPCKPADLEEASSRKSLPKLHSNSNQVVFQNISQEITIKQSSPKPQNTVDAKLVKKPTMVNRPVSTNNKLLKKGICKNTEIFSIDDSDSDDIDAKKSTNLPKSINSSPKVDLMGNKTPLSQAVPAPESFKLKNVSVKPVRKIEEVNSKALVPVSTSNEHEDDDFLESDFEETEPDESVNNPNLCETQKFLMNNKNITIKSSNSSQTKIVKNMTQKVVNVAEKSVTKMDNEFSEDEDNLHFDSEDDVNQQSLQKDKNKSNFGKESVVDSFKDFDSDSDEFPHEDEVEDSPEEASNSLINKLKNINKNLSIKSNNPTIPTSSKTNIEHNVMKRNLNNDNSSQSNTAPKQARVANSNKFEDNKQTIQPMQVSNNQMRTVNHQASTSSTNKVQQKVTTSVRRIETETVVEEITTTVTRTIKTVNQTVNKQVTMSGSQTNVVSDQPLRFASPHMISGPRSHQIRNITGTRVRAPMTDVRPRMRPTRPVVANNVRFPTPSQRMPNAPRVRLNAPTTNVTPVNPGTSNQPRGPRPLKVSPNVIGQLNRANQSFANFDKPGHFSCFRKPKEAITPLNEIPDCLPAGSSSMVQESNFSNKKTIVKSDSAGTSQVRSEISASAHQQIKKCNMAGVKVAKRSIVQQVCTVEQRDLSSANRSTMDAIQRLQRSGLLVKKPRIEEAEEEMSYNSEDEVPHEGPLLAIEDGT